MDNYKIWIYVIIGAIWLLSRLRKKPSQAPSGERNVTGQPDISSPGPGKQKALTFEELLKEISESKQARQEPAPAKFAPPIRPAYVDYDDNVGEEERDLEVITDEVPYRAPQRDSRYDPYNTKHNFAANATSLEDTLKLSDTDLTFAKFKEFEEEERRDLLKEFTRDLQDPESLKKAFVLSEILQRRF